MIERVLRVRFGHLRGFATTGNLEDEGVLAIGRLPRLRFTPGGAERNQGVPNEQEVIAAH
jgi:hypothetical protein